MKKKIFSSEEINQLSKENIKKKIVESYSPQKYRDNIKKRSYINRINDKSSGNLLRPDNNNQENKMIKVFENIGNTSRRDRRTSERIQITNDIGNDQIAIIIPR